MAEAAGWAMGLLGVAGAGLGQSDSVGPGGYAAGPWGSASLSWVLKRAVEFCSRKPKEAKEVRLAFDKGKRWPEMVPLPAHMTQGYGSTFC